MALLDSRLAAKARLPALLTSLLVGPGGGHLTIGEWKRAAQWYSGHLLPGGCLCLAIKNNYPVLALLLFATSAALYLAAVLDALKRAGNNNNALPSWRLVGALLIALFAVERLEKLAIRHYVVEAFEVPAGSMAPTLLTGDHFYADKTFDNPKRGDVVVFKPPIYPGIRYIKRVVAIGGDTVEMRGQTLIVNGSATTLRLLGDAPTSGDQPAPPGKVYEEAIGLKAHQIVVYQPQGGNFGPVKVPSGAIFVLGDNRDNSSDSRVWGFVPIENMQGRALFVWWSRSPDGTFRWDRTGLLID